MDADALFLLFGGSFNPPHMAHMRLALEAAEILRPRKAAFIPCARPPHKSGDGLLPFSLRCAMLSAAVRGTAAEGLFEVCEIENNRKGPSYTAETLEWMAGLSPSLRLVFMMGNEDYSRLETWRHWRQLPVFADLAVLPRSADAEKQFSRTSAKLWPEAAASPPPYAGVGKSFILPHGGKLLYLPQPLLEVSSTLIRERYLTGRSLDFLLPKSVLQLLSDHATIVDKAWKQPCP